MTFERAIRLILEDADIYYENIYSDSAKLSDKGIEVVIQYEDAYGFDTTETIMILWDTFHNTINSPNRDYYRTI